MNITFTSSAFDENEVSALLTTYGTKTSPDEKWYSGEKAIQKFLELAEEVKAQEMTRQLALQRKNDSGPERS